MLIAISGSQGSGKSTVLNELRALGYPVIERKTARSILDEWGVSLDTVNASFDLKLAFQDELVRRKYNDELEATLSPEVYFTERTYSDLFTYSLISFGQYNKYDEWLDRYFETCQTYCHASYEHVFYIESKFFNNIEKDGVRSINRHYSRLIDHTMLDITRQMIYDNKITIIETPNLTERVDIIIKNIKENSNANN
jgi:predicted ATPase